MAGVATRCLQQRPCRVPSLVPHCVEFIHRHELAVQVATGRLCRRRYQFAFQAPQALRERMQLLRKSAGSIFIFAFWWLADERDRKSTRLNSSHEWISYAVFCLKKKRKGI